MWGPAVSWEHEFLLPNTVSPGKPAILWWGFPPSVCLTSVAGGDFYLMVIPIGLLAYWSGQNPHWCDQLMWPTGPGAKWHDQLVWPIGKSIENLLVSRVGNGYTESAFFVWPIGIKAVVGCSLNWMSLLAWWLCVERSDLLLNNIIKYITWLLIRVGQRITQKWQRSANYRY